MKNSTASAAGMPLDEGKGVPDDVSLADAPGERDPDELAVGGGVLVTVDPGLLVPVSVLAAVRD